MLRRASSRRRSDTSGTTGSAEEQKAPEQLAASEDDSIFGDPVQWYPGHMAKARRYLQQALPLIDVVLEVADARIPRSSRNPDLDMLIGGKPRVLLLAREDLADPRQTKLWMDHFRRQGLPTVAADLRRAGWQGPVVRLLRRTSRVRSSTLRVVVVGIPNTGKSTAINALTRKRGAKTGNIPGITRGTQWLSGYYGIEMLDTPGLLWPRLDDPRTSFALAVTGAIPDRLLDMESVALGLLELLLNRYPQRLRTRYGDDINPGETLSAEAWFERVAMARRLVRRGGEIDRERTAAALIHDFRSGRLGRITLEQPSDLAADSVVLVTKGERQGTV